jgi:predicted  nucleic acid-binding Zn-ribbon protein
MLDRVHCFAASAVFVIASAIGCSSNNGFDRRVSEMRQQYATVSAEIELTQKQVEDVEQRIADAPKAGTTKREANGVYSIAQGPSPDLFRRKDALEDRLVELKSQQKGLETELSNLRK